MNDSFPRIRFKGKLRPSQAAALEVARAQLDAGQRRLNIVAPPGSGKTILGLYLWAECIRRPALVLSPNSAIQAQWAARTDLFDFETPPHELIGMTPREPRLLTSLTYQAVTLPMRGDAELDERALERWRETLVEKEEARDPEEARVWIEDLERHNRDYYEQRLAVHRKEARDAQALGGQALNTLHESSRAALEALKRRGIGLVILDESHHLLGHWGRVLADACELFEQPVVIGLTATPPDRHGKRPEDLERYDAMLGPVDYEVPTPAVVKDGYLAPYQDLAYFVRPTTAELTFIANADRELHGIVEDLCAGPSAADDSDSHRCAESLPAWLARVLADCELPTGPAKNWRAFERRDPSLAHYGRVFLLARGLALPPGVSPPDAYDASIGVEAGAALGMEVLAPVLDRYVRHRLRRSDDPADHALADRVIRRLRVLGVQITETGCQACASPVGRVLAYSKAKAAALLDILKAERRVLDDRIRAIVVTDYERTSAVAAQTRHLLDEEAGGAIAAFRALLGDEETDALDPVLVTGSTVLVDDDLAPKFAAAAKAWLDERKLRVVLEYAEERGFMNLRGAGPDWAPRVYVEMITHFFQTGLTKCLVGTRGLLGEGWDANKVNVLIDLTTVTTAMSVNQLRGRSIRLDPAAPEKLANNWDVVCLAPEFSKGLDDYARFIAKHKTIFGLTDDGAIEKGVGHVHPAFTELKPEGVEGSAALLNAEMLARAERRAEFRDMWRIGEPFKGEPLRAIEAKPLAGGEGGFPPFGRSQDPWTGQSLALAIGEAILGALREAGLIERQGELQVNDRAGGYVRAFLKDANEKDGALFAQCMREALGPLRRPRYVIPRQVDVVADNWLSNVLPEVLARYVRTRRRTLAMLHAVPSELARKKELAALYGRHWNRRVSPGAPLYAHRGAGEELVEQARRDGHLPTAELHDKEIFR